MALLTVKEISERTGIAEKNIHTYRSRKKLVVNDRGLYDTTNQINAQFINKHTAKLKAKQIVQDLLSSETDTDNEDEEPKPKTEKKAKAQDPKNDKEESLEDGYARRLVLAELLKKERSAEQALLTLQKTQIELDKRRGEVVPSAMIAPLFEAHNRSVIFEFKNLTDDLMRELSSAFELTVDQQANWRKRIVDGINKAIDKSVEGSIRSLENIINEFADKRGVGEHN